MTRALPILLVSLGMGAATVGAGPVPEARVVGPIANPETETADFRVGPGDVLQVDVWQEPEISGRFPVESGGSIQHPLLGSFAVAGKTAAEIAAALEAELADGYLKRARVSARVVEFKSFRVSVIGGVKKPGFYYLRGRDDLFSAVLLAGGFESTIPGVATVLRSMDGDGKPVVLTADLREFVRTGESRHNIDLQPGDLILVPLAGEAVNPKTGITVVGEVKTPGVFEASGGDTVLSVVLRAGGPTEFASRNGTRVYRAGETTKPTAVRLADILDRGARKKDLSLRPGDLVVVPSRLF